MPHKRNGSKPSRRGSGTTREGNSGQRQTRQVTTVPVVEAVITTRKALRWTLTPGATVTTSITKTDLLLVLAVFAGATNVNRLFGAFRLHAVRLYFAPSNSGSVSLNQAPTLSWNSSAGLGYGRDSVPLTAVGGVAGVQLVQIEPPAGSLIGDWTNRDDPGTPEKMIDLFIPAGVTALLEIDMSFTLAVDDTLVNVAVVSTTGSRVLNQRALPFLNPQGYAPYAP